LFFTGPEEGTLQILAMRGDGEVFLNEPERSGVDGNEADLVAFAPDAEVIDAANPEASEEDVAKQRERMRQQLQRKAS
jgi:5,10-methylenetetrahydrofolate reductase